MIRKAEQNQSYGSAQAASVEVQTTVNFLKVIDNRCITTLAIFVFVVDIVLAAWGNITRGAIGAILPTIYWIAVLIISFYLLFMIKIARQWERAMAQCLGRIDGLKEPYLFWIVLIIGSSPMLIDHWVTVTLFSTKKIVIKDTMPVDTMNLGKIMDMASYGQGPTVPMHPHESTASF